MSLLKLLSTPLFVIVVHRLPLSASGKVKLLLSCEVAATWAHEATATTIRCCKPDAAKDSIGVATKGRLRMDSQQSRC
ncbi:hypothetical protein GOP47_0018114 [Adiantum capillus-veneris]|uniref:Secreted protein n=1 Tax=Adiantum capillus-veneris TaxID=13818 RepID=A0A9D4ZCG6_ADICA|nr:hypothetical protein GOP47_0018114 [Adiantum capillus-veneris]